MALNDIRRFDQTQKLGESRMEKCMKSLQQNGQAASSAITVVVCEQVASEETFSLNCVGRRWFLQQHMLAGLQRLQRPLKMQAVWQRYVNRINGWIFDESLIRCVDGGDVIFLGVGVGFGLVSCGNGCNDDFRVGFGRMDDSCRSDGGE